MIKLKENSDIVLIYSFSIWFVKMCSNGSGWKLSKQIPEEIHFIFLKEKMNYLHRVIWTDEN